MMETIFFSPWVWIIPVILLIAAIAIVVDRIWLDWFGPTIFGALILLIGLPFYFGDFLPPYDADFYKTYRVTGELVTLESALSNGDGTVSQTFIAEVDGVDYFIESEDQRFRTLEVGDEVTLVCNLNFAYFVDPTLGCSFGGSK